MKQVQSRKKARKSDLSERASVLAKLTKNLALCCLGKETEIFAQSGLSSSEGQLLLLANEAQTISPSLLAERLGVGRSRMTPLVQSLVDKGFLARKESAEDRRVRDLSLTESGKRIAQQANAVRQNFHVRLLESFSAGERDELLTTLQTLHERMSVMRRELKPMPAISH